jgi:RNA polymerase sigma-70 factor, ECF subfamily
VIVSDPGTDQLSVEGVLEPQELVSEGALHSPAMSSFDRKRKRETDEAFRSALEPVTPAAWRVLRRCGVGPAELEDALQLVLVQIARRWPTLASLPSAELRAYACCAAAGVASDLGRARLRNEGRSSALEGEPADKSADPEQVFERKEAEASIDWVLMRMPPERRKVFILYEIEELSSQQIAEHLGIPLGTVASRLRKAREEFEASVGLLRQRDQGRLK